MIADALHFCLPANGRSARLLYQLDCHIADPAAEEFQYPVSFDIRDLVTLEDVIEECELGPNGSAMSCA